MGEDENEEFSVGGWFKLKPLSTVRVVAHIVKSNFLLSYFVMLHRGLIFDSIPADSTVSKRPSNTDLVS